MASLSFSLCNIFALLACPSLTGWIIIRKQIQSTKILQYFSIRNSVSLRFNIMYFLFDNCQLPLVFYHIKVDSVIYALLCMFLIWKVLLDRLVFLSNCRFIF